MLTVLEVLEATEGGTRRHVRDLVFALDPQAFRVVLAVSCERDAAFRETDVPLYAARGIQVCEVPMRRVIRPFADGVSLARLVRTVRRTAPAVIHAHSAKAGFLGRLAGLWCGVPVIYTPHVFPFLMAGGRARRWLYRCLERWAVRATAAVIAVSEEEVCEARRLGYASERVMRIRNGVAAGALPEVTVRENVPLRVGFFGRLVRQKGPDVLMESVAETVVRVPGTVFVFRGGGEMEPALRGRARALGVDGAVTFSGAYSQTEAVERMREADIVALPSRWEGCPYSVLEAFQAGVPLAASAVGGVPDLIADGVSGLLVPPDDPSALSAALVRLLRDPGLRRRLAEGGREVLPACRLSAMAEDVGALYRRIGQGFGNH